MIPWYVLDFFFSEKLTLRSTLSEKIEVRGFLIRKESFCRMVECPFSVHDDTLLPRNAKF